MDTCPIPPTKSTGYVLILEEDFALAKILGLAMENFGIPAIVLGNAKDGLEWIRANPGRLALLLTDISMSGGSGCVELARRVSNAYPNVPIITMSAGGESPDFQTYRVLDKPFDLTALLTTITAAMRSS